MFYTEPANPGMNDMQDVVSTVARAAGEPAQDRALVLQVGAAEAAAQRRFFVAVTIRWKTTSTAPA